MSDSQKTPPARRRISRDPVVPKFHVEDKPPGGKIEDGDRQRDREFLSEVQAEAWSDARYKARMHVAKKRPDLSAKRAETAAFEIAEALHECAEISTGAASDPAGDSEEADDGSAAHAEQNSSGHLNGSSTDHGEASDAHS